MKLLISSLTLTLCCLMLPTSTQAQQDDQAYVIVEYMKVKPGMYEQYVDCEGVWKLIQAERKNAGLITGWELEEVLYPSGTDTEYDFITITHVKNWNAIAELNSSWNEETWNMLTKNLTSEQLEIADAAEDYRDLVKREIWTAGDMVFAAGSNQPSFRIENFMKIPADGWDAWIEMETEFVKPIHEKNVALGNRAGWVLTFMTFPRGEDLTYQASTVDFYDSWEDMNSDDGAAWDMVYPDMSDEEITERILSVRTLVRSEVRMLIDFVE